MADNSRRISNTNALNGLWPGLPSPHERAPMEQANPEATSSSTTQPASLFADPTSPSLSLSLSHSRASPLTAASPTRHPSYYTHTYFASPPADHQATPPEASPTAYHHHAAFSGRQDRQSRDDALTSPPRLSSTLTRQEDQDDIFADAFEHDIALTMESNSPHDNAGAFQEREGGASSSSSGNGNGNGVDGVYQLPLRHRPLLSSGARSESDQVSAISQYVRDIWHDPGQAQSAVDDTTPQRTSIRNMAGASKRPRQRFENADDKHITHTLHNHGAVAVIAYNSETPDPQANDIWPQCRSSAKLPAKYYLLDPSRQNTSDGKHQPSMNRNNNQEACNQQQEAGHLPAGDPIGRPKWELPVELVELIAEYLNRDDIKALRLVSRELNRNVSQVIFQTVVVPFNTEIYGMLGKDVEPDLKGKKRAKFESLNYSWKNANGDEVYNGHGLDVFRGFGKHIRKYGMSFEVNEDSLAAPPVKLLTENKTSFWGRYDWPFDEYRRFDAVAGLETAADETPRMKTAFSELTKVKELALSVDSGLGWLSGPDKSIRARILRKPSSVFGTAKAIPDRRAQAQQELWRHLQLYHQQAGSDIRHATLYKVDGQRPLSELKEAGMLAGVEPEMPYLDPQLIHEATPHDFVDIAVPASLEDPYVLERFISTPSSLGTGVLFTSNNSPPDAGQVVNPIIPANLTKAQQEWLLETEWAQRAFMSSYMLSIIDNPTTFQAVHSLNISGLSDRYLPMLNRSDFWDALPSLCDVTLMVIPGWRTVHKDEAGFVATPPVDPAESTNVLYVLLLDQIARRPNIRRLTVGWTTGGECAEGLYARNKLLCPAPILDLRELMDSRFSLTPAALFVADPLRMGLWLLPLRHVEKLTLKNCWITPQALLQFSKMHDKARLKELVLDSVSLMVIPHPNAPNIPLNFGNPQAPPPQHAPAQMGMNVVGGFVGAPVGQFTPHQQQQIVQVYINALQLQLQQLQTNAGGLQHNHVATLQFALQQQLQQVQQMQNPNGQNVPLQAQAHGQGQNQVPVPVPLHMPVPPLQHQPAHTHANFTLVTHIAAQVNQMQNQLAAGQHVAAGQQPLNHGPAHNPATPNAQSTLRAKPRPWSWMDIIDQISPGTNLSDFGSTHSRADSQRTTSLRQIEFISCGYAKFTHAPSEQNAVDHGVAATLRHPWFARRMVALSPAMMSTKWPYLADIIQEVDPLELAALDAGWNLRTGWEDSEAAQAVEFDGLLPGGTGRFTGIIRQSDKMVDEASTNLSNLAL